MLSWIFANLPRWIINAAQNKRPMANAVASLWYCVSFGWVLHHQSGRERGIQVQGGVSVVSIAILCYMMQVRPQEELKPLKVFSTHAPVLRHMVGSHWTEGLLQHGSTRNLCVVNISTRWFSKFNLEVSEFNILLRGWPLYCLLTYLEHAFQQQHCFRLICVHWKLLGISAVSDEILKLQETHYLKRENITLFRFSFPSKLFSGWATLKNNGRGVRGF